MNVSVLPQSCVPAHRGHPDFPGQGRVSAARRDLGRAALMPHGCEAADLESLIGLVAAIAAAELPGLCPAQPVGLAKRKRADDDEIADDDDDLEDDDDVEDEDDEDDFDDDEDDMEEGFEDDDLDDDDEIFYDEDEEE